MDLTIIFIFCRMNVCSFNHSILGKQIIYYKYILFISFGG